jgi:hypothetical protein
MRRTALFRHMPVSLLSLSDLHFDYRLSQTLGYSAYEAQKVTRFVHSHNGVLVVAARSQVNIQLLLNLFLSGSDPDQAVFAPCHHG